MERRIIYLLVLLVLFGCPGLAETIGPVEALKDVYTRMNLDDDSYIMDLEVTNYIEGADKSKALVRVYLKDGERSVATFLSPERMQNDRYLVIKNDTWMYKEGLKRPIRISARQKLFGNAGIAETIGIDYNQSYQLEDFVREEDTYILDLKARAPVIAYQEARVWVNYQKGQLERVILKGLNGQAIKELIYSNYRQINGHQVGDILIKNLLQEKDKETKVIFKDIRKAELPASAFQPLMLNKFGLLVRDK